MAKVSGISIYVGEFDPTDQPDRIVVDYNDNSQKVLEKDTDVSGESTKIKNIHSAYFN
tara:strand:- start:407 stop:580 length:174 start_codon:yes stop_codon:yes gene_type:complete